MEFKADEFIILLMRWIHFLSGVTWIGLLYYFNIVQVPFMKETDPGTKSGVVQKLLPRALWWFRYAALVTVLSGLIIVWSHFTHGHGHGIFSTSWGISIAIGGGLGIIMFLNVWLLIWPNQKVVIRITTRSEEHTSELQSLAYLVCRLLLEKKKQTRGRWTCNQESQPAGERRRRD